MTSSTTSHFETTIAAESAAARAHTIGSSPSNEAGQTPEETTNPDHALAVLLVLGSLYQADIHYCVWGAAACVHHGGRWLWKSQDFEILVDASQSDPEILRTLDTITTHHAASWTLDTHFSGATWAAHRGDRPPRWPTWRFRHTSGGDWGIVVAPASDMHVSSMHAHDLETGDPLSIGGGRGDLPRLWVFPNLKTYVETQLRLWSYAGRNSALVELMDVVARSRGRVDARWAESVGLEVPGARRRRAGETQDLPSMVEVWEEILRRAEEQGG